jgi:hypothetical protein
MSKIIDEIWKPQIEPNGLPNIENDVKYYRISINKSVIQEIFTKDHNYFGFRYWIWVAWRDAGNIIQDHSWFQKEPIIILVDKIEDAKTIAENHAKNEEILFSSEWIAK